MPNITAHQRALPLALAIAAVLALIAGCGGGGQTFVAPSGEPSAEASAPAGGLAPYSNEEYGFSMSFPGGWGGPEEERGENGLDVIAMTEDSAQNIVVVVRDIPSETPTLEEYRVSMGVLYREVYEGSVFERDETVRINGAEFWALKIVDETPGSETVQLVYTVFGDEYAYEATITLTPEYYEANGALFDEIAQTIRLGK